MVASPSLNTNTKPRTFPSFFYFTLVFSVHFRLVFVFIPTETSFHDRQRDRVSLMNRCSCALLRYRRCEVALARAKERVLVLRPGFEPGSVAREATILNRTILPEPELHYSLLIYASDI